MDIYIFKLVVIVEPVDMWIGKIGGVNTLNIGWKYLGFPDVG